MVIVIDSREKAEAPRIYEALKRLVPVEVKTLSAGDYYISPEDQDKKGLVIERKTCYDFVASVRDRRLWEQLQLLKSAENAEPALLLESERDESPFTRVKRFSDWGKPAMISILNSVIFDFKVPVLFTFSTRETVICLVQLTKKYSGIKRRKIYPLRVKPKFRNLDEACRYILEGFEDIGPATADLILKHYKTLDSFFQNYWEVDKIPGVGVKRRDRIIEVMTHEYGTEEGD